MRDDTATHDPRDGGDADSSESPSSANDTMEAKYRIDRVIASGGMGVVLAATHRHLGTRVAIKQLHDASDGMRPRFLREAKLAAAFDSPYVARVRDYGFTADGQPFLVMDHLEGRTLKARLDEGMLPQVEALRLAREIVLALVEVHRANVVHRDVKPSNIFLVRDAEGVEHVKLIDFGIAKRLANGRRDSIATQITQTGEVLGTVCYMAAEQVRVAAEVDLRADIFSVGAVMYEMLSGRRAFDSTARGVALATSRGERDVGFVPLGSLVRGLGTAIEEVVARCLAFEPRERFESAQALLDALPSDPGAVAMTTTLGTRAAWETSGAGSASSGVEAEHGAADGRRGVRSRGVILAVVVTLGLIGAGLTVRTLGRTSTAEPPSELMPPSAALGAPASTSTVAPEGAQSPSVLAPITSAPTAASASAAGVAPVPSYVRPRQRKPRFDERQ